MVILINIKLKTYIKKILYYLEKLIKCVHNLAWLQETNKKKWRCDQNFNGSSTYEAPYRKQRKGIKRKFKKATWQRYTRERDMTGHSIIATKWVWFCLFIIKNKIKWLRNWKNKNKKLSSFLYLAQKPQNLLTFHSKTHTNTLCLH